MMADRMNVKRKNLVSTFIFNEFGLRLRGLRCAPTDDIMLGSNDGKEM
jgi:hypothetical protein